jgi:hypothetical protein
LTHFGRHALLRQQSSMETDMSGLNGDWSYRSYCPVKTASPPQDIAPWAPPGALSVATDSTGKVVGHLTFSPGAVLTVSGSVTPASGKVPEGVELVGEGMGAKYNIRGFFVAGSNHIVGTVVAVQKDLANQPDGTSGPFLLFPIIP